MEKRSRRRTRDLVTQAASQGLSENEIGCARISMMARSTNAPCKGRIQMRKTNPLHLFTFGLQRTAGPYSWVICVGLAAHRRLPLYPQEQTSSPPVGMSQCAHKAPFLRGSNERGRKSLIEEIAKLFEDFP
jgi:hypothetical protein